MKKIHKKTNVKEASLKKAVGGATVVLGHGPTAPSKPAPVPPSSPILHIPQPPEILLG